MASGHMLRITGNSLFESLFFNQRPDRKGGLLLGPSESEDLSLFEQKWKIKFPPHRRFSETTFNY